MSPESVAEIKKAMGYNDGSKCCGNCQHFEESDSPDGPKKLNCCSINIFDIPVSAQGWCPHGSHNVVGVA